LGTADIVKFERQELDKLVTLMFATHHLRVVGGRRECTMDESERLKAGDAARRRVLGDAHVDRYAWGEIWTRPGLDERTRRLLVLAMLVALGRDAEFKVHLKAGLEHGLSASDVKEVLLQAAVYCGLPAANGAFQIAQEVFADLKKD
jgi:4-carboxymuconolactone decarboxylase